MPVFYQISFLNLRNKSIDLEAGKKILLIKFKKEFSFSLYFFSLLQYYFSSLWRHIDKINFISICLLSKDKRSIYLSRQSTISIKCIFCLHFTIISNCKYISFAFYFFFLSAYTYLRFPCTVKEIDLTLYAFVEQYLNYFTSLYFFYRKIKVQKHIFCFICKKSLFFLCRHL